MDTWREIDTTFNFKNDTPPGKDPDAFSPTLRRYHKFLWSKPLPNGVFFTLDDTPPHYLHHQSKAGEFFLSSDSVIPTFTRERRIASIIDQIPQEEREAFYNISYTIGGMMIFPSNRIDGKSTINGQRGIHPRIKDRFDLTVECIRRYYRDEHSPLGNTLARYAGFFELFGTFRGYVDYFFLHDLVTEDYSAVRFFTSFEGFIPYPIPATIESYKSYRRLAVDFIEARNRRIAEFADARFGVPRGCGPS